MKKFNNIKNIFLLVYLALPLFPNYYFVDRVGFDWPYLSIINLIFLVTFFYLKEEEELFTFFMKNKKLVIAIFGFFLTCTLSIIKSVNINESLYELVHYLTFLISFLIIYFLVKTTSIKVNTLALFLIIFSLIEISIPLNRIFLDYLEGNTIERARRYSGFAGNINILSFSLILKLPIFYYLILKTYKTKTFFIFSCITVFLNLILIFILQSRGAYLALILSHFIIFFYILLFNRSYLKFLFLFGALIITSLVTTNYMQRTSNTSTFVDRAQTIIQYKQNTSISSRIEFYKDVLESSLKNPLLGKGIGNWKLASIEPRKNTIDEYIIPYHAHNDFLQVLAEIGFFGLFFYLIFYYYPLYIAYIRKKNLLVFILGLGSFIVYVVDSNLNFPIARPYNFIQYFLFIHLIFNLSSQNEIL